MDDTDLIMIIIFHLLYVISGLTYHCRKTCETFKQSAVNHKRHLQTGFSPLQICNHGPLVSVERLLRNTDRTSYRNFASVATTIQRNPLYSSINCEDIFHFKNILGEKNVIQDEEKLVAANTDWMRKYKGSSKLMLQPRSTEEVCIFYRSQNLLLLIRHSSFVLIPVSLIPISREFRF